MTQIKFPPEVVASCGLPRKAAYIAYDEKRRYADNSVWLDKQSRFEPGIEKLISLADKIFYH